MKKYQAYFLSALVAFSLSFILANLAPGSYIAPWFVFMSILSGLLTIIFVIVGSVNYFDWDI